MQQRRLGLADVGRQVLEAGGLAGLALQIVDLAFEFADHVVEALEVLLGGAQPKLRLVAPRVQAGNAGRLFQQRAARLRLRLDQLADAALPDHGGRAGACRLVGKQKLHVLGARFLAVDAVDRAGLALDAARHLQFVGVVEGGGRGAVDIVEEKRDFRGVSRRPRAGAREDDVVHAGRAHVLVRAFAHHPAQRLDEVRLAAAVRADDAGQPALDDELARFDEGFESEKAKAGKLHARLPQGERKPARPRTKQASEHAVDDRRHFRNRQGPFVGIPVDEKGRGGVHLELFLALLSHRSHIVQKLLVRQAGLEGLL